MLTNLQKRSGGLDPVHEALVDLYEMKLKEDQQLSPDGKRGVYGKANQLFNEAIWAFLATGKVSVEAMAEAYGIPMKKTSGEKDGAAGRSN
jgi:hypothetical protein